MIWNYNHLYYFYITAKEGSVTSASKTIGIQQPSLTSQLKKIECQLDKKLFKKDGRFLALTEDGKSLFSICEKMFSNSADIAAFYKNSKLNANDLRLGISDEVERPFIVDLASKVLTKNNETKSTPRFLLRSENNSTLSQLICEEKIHAAVTTTQLQDDFEILSQVSMPVVLVVPTETVSDVFDREVLAQQKWILPAEGSKLRDETNIFFQRIGITPFISLESNTIASIVRAVGRNLGCAFLPKNYLGFMVGAGLISIGRTIHPLWFHQLLLVKSKKTKTNPALLEFIDVFEQKSTLYHNTSIERQDA